MIEPTEARDIGIYFTALAAFTDAYGTQVLSTASFFMASVGFLSFSYGLVSARNEES
jgi:hypothetical protein